MISEIKNDIESKNKQMMEKIKILTSKHDKISEDMNILKGKIKQLLEAKMSIGPTSDN
jgi:hypothetical protein